MTRTGLPAGGEGAVQGEHEVVAGSQCVRPDGPGRAWLAERGCHDQGLAPPAWLQAAMRRHPPAACVLPDLRPTMPSWPSSVLVLRITPATGTTAVGIAVIAAGAGTYIAAMPKRTWSAVVLTVDESRPEASVYRVPVMPRRRAAAFIRATNASWLPASHRASPVVVALFAADKARLGDVFYDGAAARADPLIDQWKRETAQKEEE